MEIVKALQQVEGLKDVPEEQLAWLANNSECLEIRKGDNLFAPGDPINRLQIVLEGSYVIKVPQKDQLRTIGKIGEKTITGLLPYSRAQSARAYAVASEDSKVVALSERFFREMVSEHHELTTVFVHTMSTRIRQFTKQEQQNDKMMALGKLSAGLAHELNNPSAAVVRSSQELKRHLKLTPDKFKDVIRIKMTDEEVDRVNEVLFSKVNGGKTNLTLTEQSEREE